MAKTNLLAQNDNLAIESLKQSVGRSVMNLSHSVTFPIDVDGAILPICCVETVPSDSFEISVECLLRQLTPLKVPVMTNFRLNTAFYYCDNRLGWKKWERFMQGGRSGNEVYDLPRIYTQKYSRNGFPDKYILSDFTNPQGSILINYANSLHTYFGISLNTKTESSTGYDDVTDESADLPLAFPFFDYQIICRDFYTDVDRLPQNPKAISNGFNNFSDLTSDWAYSNLFPVDEDEFKLVDGLQYKCGFNTDDDLQHSSEIKGCVLDKVRYHEVRPDYFSSSKKAPMRGDAPVLQAMQSMTIPAGTSFSFDTDASQRTLQTSLRAGGTSGSGTTILGGSSPIKIVPDENDNATFIAYKSESVPVTIDTWTSPYGIAHLPDNLALTTHTDTSISGQVDTSFTAAEIRLLSQLTVWQELNMLHKPYYNDFLNAHFDGVHVGDSPAERPQYIGGTSQVVSINEILQTSASSDTSALGTQGATAMSLASNYVGKYFCNNYGYIIGVAYIIPDLYYNPAIPRHFSRRAKEDYYSPEFANLSMQATLNKEIFYSNNDEWNNSPWGYTGAFDEMRSIPNRIAGNLLNDSYQDLQAWVLRRRMANDNLPSMSTSWLSLKGNVEKTAFQVPNMPAFMLQCANYIKAVRPMPKVAIPKAL